MQTIHIHIDITSSTGRRLLKHIERYPDVAIVEYPLPETLSGQNTLEYASLLVEEELNNYYSKIISRNIDLI